MPSTDYFKWLGFLLFVVTRAQFCLPDQSMCWPAVPTYSFTAALAPAAGASSTISGTASLDFNLNDNVFYLYANYTGLSSPLVSIWINASAGGCLAPSGVTSVMTLFTVDVPANATLNGNGQFSNYMLAIGQLGSSNNVAWTNDFKAKEGATYRQASTYECFNGNDATIVLITSDFPDGEASAGPNFTKASKEPRTSSTTTTSSAVSSSSTTTTSSGVSSSSTTTTNTVTGVPIATESASTTTSTGPNISAGVTSAAPRTNSVSSCERGGSAVLALLVLVVDQI